MSDAFLERFDEYHKFVGMFITSYADLEYDLRNFLERLSGLGSDSFEVLMGFPRTSEALAKLRKMISLSRDLNDEDRAAINDAFSQLDIVTKLRDRIVHYGGGPAGDNFIVRARPTDKSPETKASHDFFELQELRNAIWDLSVIKNVLSFRLRNRGWPTEKGLAVSGVKQVPWQYIPPGKRQNPTQPRDWTPER